MTGLNVDNQTFVEVAAVVTDENLNILAESQNIVIHQSDEVLQNMEEWPKKHLAIVNW